MISMIYVIVFGAVLAGFLLGSVYGIREGRDSLLVEMDEHRKTIADAIREAMKIIDQARASVPLPHRITTAQGWLNVALGATYDMQRPKPRPTPPDHIHPFTFGEPDNDTSKRKGK